MQNLIKLVSNHQSGKYDFNPAKSKLYEIIILSFSFSVFYTNHKSDKNIIQAFEERQQLTFTEIRRSQK